MLKKVLIISAIFPPMKGGGSDYALRLAQELAAAHCDVYVLTTNIKNIVTDPNITVLPILHDWSWNELGSILSVVRQCKPDIINLHFSAWAFNDHPMISFLPLFLRWLFPNVFIVTLVESHFGMARGRIGRKALFLQRLCRVVSGPCYSNYEFGTVLPCSHRIIVLSANHIRVLEKHCSKIASKAILAPPPPIMPIVPASSADRTIRRKELGLTDSEFLIAYYGYIYPSKGVETLLQALQVLSLKMPIKLIFIGDTAEQTALDSAGQPSYKNELLKQVQSMAINDHIIWTGYTSFDSDRASSSLRAADLVCLPFDQGLQLHRSSFSYSAAHGLPIVSTLSDDTEDVFVDEDNVLLCAPRDVQAIANSIERILTDASLRQRLSEGALKLSAQWYDWGTSVKAVTDTSLNVSRQVKIPGFATSRIRSSRDC